MAGDGESKFVRGARSRHGSDGPRCTNTPGDLSIGHRRAGRDFLKRFPHAFLESRAANIKGQIQTDPRRLDEPDDTSHQGLVVAVGADEMRLWEAVLKIAH